MTAPTMTLTIHREVPSQNKLQWCHWRAVQKERHAWEVATYAAACQAKAERSELPRFCLVHVLAYRKRLIRDHANLTGGAKALIDSLVSLRLIYDDDTKHMTATYDQALASSHVGKIPFTIVTITERTP